MNEKNTAKVIVERALLRPPMALFAFLTIVSGALFVNNIVYVLRWWRVFIASGGDAEVVAAGVSGLLSWLDWSAVDLSTVTTLIPFLGFLLSLRGLVRTWNGRAVGDEESFPFFPSFDSLNIALGLIGTLWGIIIIGYYKMDTVAMADLMLCLHTALFSTLMAVLWVYLVDHPILRPYLKRLRSRALKEAPREDDGADVLSLLERFRESAGGLRETWALSAESVSEFRVASEKARAELEAFTAAGKSAGASLSADLTAALREFIEQLGRAEAQMHERAQAMQAEIAGKLLRLDEAYERLSLLQGNMAEHVLKAAQLQSAFAAAAESLRSERDEALGRVAQLRDQEAALKGRVGELEGALRGAKQNAEQLAESMRANEEAFRKRLEKLRDQSDGLASALATQESRAKVAEKRADAAEKESDRLRGLLDKVKNIFG